MRNWTPCRECGRKHTNPQSSSICELCGALEREKAKKAAEYEERYRYMPASYRALDELTAAIGETATEKVKALVEAMIDEALHPERND